MELGFQPEQSRLWADVGSCPPWERSRWCSGIPEGVNANKHSEGKECGSLQLFNWEVWLLAGFPEKNELRIKECVGINQVMYVLSASMWMCVPTWVCVSVSAVCVCVVCTYIRACVHACICQRRSWEGLCFWQSMDSLPWQLNCKEPAFNAGDTGDASSIPGSGRAPGEGNGNLFQYSSLRNPMDREAWWALIHGVAKNWTWLSTKPQWTV